MIVNLEAVGTKLALLENLEVYQLTYYLFIMFFVSGPGQYDFKEAAGRGGLMTTRQDRFRPIKSETPGPGSYEVGYMDRVYVYMPIKSNPVNKDTEGTIESNNLVPRALFVLGTSLRK